MNWLDILIIVVLIILALMGWRTGAIKGLFLIVGVLAGIFLAGRFGAALGSRFTAIDDPNLARVAGFALVFLATLVTAWLASLVVKGVLTAVMLGWVDRLVGALIGAASGAFIISALIVALWSFPFGPFPKAIEDSTVAPALADNMPLVLGLLPGAFKDQLPLVSKVKSPEVALKGVTLREVSASSLTVEAQEELQNPNTVGGTLELVTYRIYYDDAGQWNLLGQGEQRKVRFRAKGETPFSLLVTVKDTRLASIVFALLSQGQAIKFRVYGTASVSFPGSEMDVPFDSTTEYRLR
ncbi:MAG: CvpA family protein [Chloroflexi bacterium]|nr:CvpA family protein [Chloroflexota bacterium]